MPPASVSVAPVSTRTRARKQLAPMRRDNLNSIVVKLLESSFGESFSEEEAEGPVSETVVTVPEAVAVLPGAVTTVTENVSSKEATLLPEEDVLQAEGPVSEVVAAVPEALAAVSRAVDILPDAVKAVGENGGSEGATMPEEHVPVQYVDPLLSRDGPSDVSVSPSTSGSDTEPLVIDEAEERSDDSSLSCADPRSDMVSHVSGWCMAMSPPGPIEILETSCIGGK